MFKTNVEYGLEGAFKVDTFDASGHLVESTDWFSNFITQTGLLFPSVYSFANCFRFLTLGRDYSTPNNGGSVSAALATTGCYSPISKIYDDVGREQDWRWIGHQAYETGTLPNNSACLTTLTENGPIFYRAWTIPTGDGVFKTDFDGTTPYITIGEFMVSPSSGANPTGRYAFSRIQRQLTLKAGYRAVVSYQLAVRVRNSNLTLLPAGAFDTGNANVDTDGDLIAQWKNLSGYYRQTWCGLSCVDRWGVSFVTKYGNGMEPSLRDLGNYYLYLSPDNAQFDVNPLSGGAQWDTNWAWRSDGLMWPLGNPNRGALTLSPNRTDEGLGTAEAQLQLFYGPEQELTTIPTSITPVNIRLGSQNVPLKTVHLRGYTGDISNENVFGSYTDTEFNYQVTDRYVDASIEEISYATPGGSGRDLNRAPYYHERAVFSSRIFRLPMNMDVSGNPYQQRRKTITRKAVFPPAASLGYNTRFGSMVFAHKVPNDSDEPGNYTFYPTVDCLFYDTSGRTMLQHYRMISGIYLTSRGSGVVGTKVNITGTSPAPNILRHLNLTTLQGPIVTGGFSMTGYVGSLNRGPSNFWMSGDFSATGQPGNTNFANTSSGFYGYGAVYGVWDSSYASASTMFDTAIADHNTGISGDNHTGAVYWPNVFGTKLGVQFWPIVYSGINSSVPGGTVFHRDNGESDATLAASGFQRPSGVILHFDALGITGYRLLPNYGVGNVINLLGTGTNIYEPTVGYSGGCLPGLSVDNGLEVYLDISWGSPCGSADDCNEPTLP